MTEHREREKFETGIVEFTRFKVMALLIDLIRNGKNDQIASFFIGLLSLDGTGLNCELKNVLDADRLLSCCIFRYL